MDDEKSAGSDVVNEDALTTVSTDWKSFAQLIAVNFGVGNTLDIGCGQGELVKELISLNVDAHGLDVSEEWVEKGNKRFPARFFRGSVLASPFYDEAFDVVISKNCLEHLSPSDLMAALREMRRISRRYLFLQISIECDDESLKRDRAWWERCCFEAGFRKHPSHYKINDYVSLGNDGREIRVALEKISDAALAEYPLAALDAEDRLHADILRQVGEKSDVRMARYRWAASFVRPGDRVLDAACGMGAGSYALSEFSNAAEVIGIDSDAYAIEYARINFSLLNQNISFSNDSLPVCLSEYSDGFFDLIVFFNELEYSEKHEIMLSEFERLISPGGRVIVCSRNDDGTYKSYESAHHLAGALEKLKLEISKNFIPECLALQTSSDFKSKKLDAGGQATSRIFCDVSINTQPLLPCEWWIMVGMKNPVSNDISYRESVYGYSAPPAHLLKFEEAYSNPWLIRSMLEFQFRAKNPDVLRNIASEVLSSQDEEISVDAAAALAVLGYQMLSDVQKDSDDVEEFIDRLKPYVENNSALPHFVRWQVSHAYLIAQLYKKVGKSEESLDYLARVLEFDVLKFSPTLGTKVVDAGYEAGILEFSLGNVDAARKFWKKGVERAYMLISSPLQEFIGDIENPHEFPTIVAVEFMDSAVRCIKALRATYKNNNSPSSKVYAVSRENWKEMLADRWTAMQSMEAMIGERDKVITAQNSMLQERWSVMQSMDEMIRERDEIISTQESILQEQRTVMGYMEAFVDKKNKEVGPLSLALDEQKNAPGAASSSRSKGFFQRTLVELKAIVKKIFGTQI